MADQDITFTDPVRAHLDRVFGLERRLALYADNGQDDRLWQHAADEGWFALIAPSRDDGLDLEPGMLVPIVRLMGERLVGGSLVEQLLVAGLVLRSAPAMPGGARGRLAAALTGTTRIAVVDPRAAVAPLGAVPKMSLRGDRLDGIVDLVRFGDEADELLVVASGDSGTSVVLIDVARAGVERTSHVSSDPLARFTRVELHQVVVAPDDVVASGEAGDDLAQLIQAWMRILTASELAGIARHLLEISVEYVQERQQFGRAVGSFQSVKHLAASCAQRVILLENFCEAVTSDAAHQSTAEVALAAAALKGHATEMARLVCEDALQMHGGIGFTHEHELHWYYKRTLGLGSWYGDERALSVEVGRAVIERAANQ